MRAARIALLVALSLPLAGIAAPALAQSPSRVSVTGQGEAAIAPDMAILTLTVLREAETAREALDAANEAMSSVIAAMREEGIADRDLQTSGLSISPRYIYPERGGEPRITGYQVANTLTVRVRDFARVGAVLDLSVTLGVNQGGNIVMTNEDPAATLEAARRDAVANARAKAETLSEAAGVTLGRVLEMSEQTMSAARPLAQPAMRMEMADASVPIEGGENTYRVEVNVTFELLH